MVERPNCLKLESNSIVCLVIKISLKKLAYMPLGISYIKLERYRSGTPFRSTNGLLRYKKSGRKETARFL